MSGCGDNSGYSQRDEGRGTSGGGSPPGGPRAVCPPRLHCAVREPWRQLADTATDSAPGSTTSRTGVRAHCQGVQRAANS